MLSTNEIPEKEQIRRKRQAIKIQKSLLESSDTDPDDIPEIRNRMIENLFDLAFMLYRRRLRRKGCDRCEYGKKKLAAIETLLKK